MKHNIILLLWLVMAFAVAGRSSPVSEAASEARGIPATAKRPSNPGGLSRHTDYRYTMKYLKVIDAQHRRTLVDFSISKGKRERL